MGSVDVFDGEAGREVEALDEALGGTEGLEGGRKALLVGKRGFATGGIAVGNRGTGTIAVDGFRDVTGGGGGFVALAGRGDILVVLLSEDAILDREGKSEFGLCGIRTGVLPRLAIDGLDS